MATTPGEEQIPPNEHLTTPTLHLSNLPPTVSDEEIMRVAIECLRARPRINRDTTDQYGHLSGSIEFEKLHNAEKAYATLQDIFLPAHNYTLSLSLTPHRLYPDDPKPNSKPRLVKQLPLRISPGTVFERFRPYGPIYRIGLQQDLGFSHTIALVDFYEEQHAINAQASMHCADVEGHTIAVQIYEASKGPIRGLPQRNSWAEAPSFTPRQFSATLPTNSAASMWATPPARRTASAMHYGLPPPEVAQPIMPYGMPLMPAAPSPPAAPFIDPTNLFVKGLDPLITSQDLFSAFKPFGRIVSARVMRDEHTGLSKEFGFVSYTRAEDASVAQQAMHGQALQGANSVSQGITVRFHEPKKQRVSSYGGGGTGKRPYGMPREREGSFDSVQQMTEDIARRVSGMSPTSSPPLSPAAGSIHSTIMRHASMSSSGSSTPAEGATERDRFLTAIRPHSNSLREAEQLADLLLSLNKKDRALCLFNNDYLLSKIDDARTVLAAVESPVNAGYPTPRPTPESRSEAKLTTESPVGTLTSLAALPAGTIIDLVHSDSPPPFLANPDPSVEQETDAFIDSLDGKPDHERKQRLGEKLFKVVKAFGFKNSPKITIYLLDHEELRPLAHLMNEQSEVLKEKVAQIQNRL